MLKKLTILILIVSTLGSPVCADEPNANLEMQLWNDVKNSKNPEYLKAYVEKFPDGTFSDLAKAKLKELENLDRNRSASAAESSSNAGNLATSSGADSPSEQGDEPTSNLQTKFIYQTDFQDRKWDAGDTNIVSAQSTANGYRLESKRAVGFFAVWEHLDKVGADKFNLMDVDFDLYAKIKLVGHKGKGGYSGLLWGNDDALDNMYYAGVTPRGKQIFNYERGGVVTGPNRWKPSSVINKSKGVFNRTSPTNELKISIRGGRYKYYVNGEIVREGAYPRHLVKDNFGFYVSGLATILVKELSIRIVE